MNNQETLLSGKIANYAFKNGILYSYSKNIKRTVELISENIAFVKSITGNQPVPVILFLTPSPKPDRETRQFSANHIHEIYSCMAIVATKSLSYFVLRMVFGFQKPSIPTKLFTNLSDAENWIKQQHQYGQTN